MDDAEQNEGLSFGQRRLQVNATQACTTCRSRKSRCDEKRPSCSLCERIQVPCLYREPKPLKKDKTLQEISSRLEMLDKKVDKLITNETRATEQHYGRLEEAFVTSNVLRRLSQQGISSGQLSPRSQSSSQGLFFFQVPDRSTAEVHQILSWPAVEQLRRSDPQDFYRWDIDNASTEQWLAEIAENFGRPLVLNERVDFVIEGAFHIQPPTYRTKTLSNETIEELVSAYFSCFHYLYPVLDREHIYFEVLPKVKSNFFNESNEDSALVLLVLALGEVAQQGVIGERVFNPLANGESGVRGGSIDAPPGILFLYEALRRMGLLLPNCTLTLVQCYILAAVYYAQCSRNLEHWRMTELSCASCLSLMKITPSPWATDESDMIRRLYWMCVLLESGPTGELGVSKTRITEHKDSMILPQFLPYKRQEMFQPSNDTLVKDHFLAQIGLRNLLEHINNTLRPKRSVIAGEDVAPPIELIEVLEQQLQSWRAILPEQLRWEDGTTLGTQGSPIINNPPQLKAYGVSYAMLDPKLILSASLQTRYKYALYLIYRPYIYKALHSEEEIMPADLVGCGMALNACTDWPLLHPTFQKQKRLMPHLYEFSHTFFSILIVLHVCRSKAGQALHPVLKSTQTMEKIEESTSLILLWLRDMQSVHSVAAWCWDIIKVMYKKHPLVRNVEDGGVNGMRMDDSS